MTIRRLVLGTLLAAFPGATAPSWATELVADGLAGHVLFGRNVVDRPQIAALCTTLRAARPDVLIAIDEEGGDVTRLHHASGSPYPGNAVLGVIDDVAVTRTIYRAIGADLASAGINMDLAPTVDVNSTAENPVIGTRSFGASPALVARHSAAAVSGLRDAGVVACAKHFPGHGATTVDSHLALPTVSTSLPQWRRQDLPPFEAAISAGAEAVMTAHIRVPALTGALPATFSESALALLRSVPFDGVIVTDALEMAGAARVAGGVPGGAVLALRAGADLVCVGAAVTPDLIDAIVEAVEAAVEGGSLPLRRVEEAASRVRQLAAFAARPACADVGDAVDLGSDAARRAISVEGVLPDLSDAYVVQLESERTIAEGRVPWGLLPHIDPARHPSARVVAAVAEASDVVRAAGGRPIVVTGRNVHRLAGGTALVDALAAAGPTVVVEMGWPSAWRPSAAAYIRTYGASRASGAAAAQALNLNVS